MIMVIFDQFIQVNNAESWFILVNDYNKYESGKYILICAPQMILLCFEPIFGLRGTHIVCSHVARRSPRWASFSLATWYDSWGSVTKSKMFGRFTPITMDIAWCSHACRCQLHCSAPICGSLTFQTFLCCRSQRLLQNGHLPGMTKVRSADTLGWKPGGKSRFNSPKLKWTSYLTLCFHLPL